MGYDRHHCIVVTSFDESLLAEAHQVAVSLFASAKAEGYAHGMMVSEIVPSVTNGYSSFFVPPDGSKEGWEESRLGDSARGVFVDWLRSRRHSDGSSSLDWVEVQYGDDERATRIVRHSDER